MLGNSFEVELVQRLAIYDVRHRAKRRLASHFWQFHNRKAEKFADELRRQGFHNGEDRKHWQNAIGWFYLGEKVFEIQQGKPECCVFISSASVHKIKTRGLSGLLLSAHLHRALDASNLIGASAPKSFNPEIEDEEASYDISGTDLPDTEQLKLYYSRQGWTVHPLLKTEKGRDIMVRIPENHRWNPYTDWDLEQPNDADKPKPLKIDWEGRKMRTEVYERCHARRF